MKFNRTQIFNEKKENNSQCKSEMQKTKQNKSMEIIEKNQTNLLTEMYDQ